MEPLGPAQHGPSPAPATTIAACARWHWSMPARG